MTPEERISKWSRRFVVASAAWFSLAAIALTVETGHRAVVVLLVLGFVLHVVFGKAYSLLPTYFDRTLASARAPAVQFPFTVLGTALLATDGTVFTVDPLVGQIGAICWTVGVAVFLGTIVRTIEDNPTGAETATGEASADRRSVDRVANAFVPVVLAYLAIGTYATLAAATPLPTLLDGYPPRATHLLAAGTGALLVFTVGFRLLPRFLVADPPRALVPVVLIPGSLGPVLIAIGLPSGPVLHAGAGLEALAVVAFAAAFVILFVRSTRSRVGFYGVLAGSLFGVVAAALGLLMAFGTPSGPVQAAHFRVNLLGFLALTIIGVEYQFYPPTVGTFTGASDRTAAVILGALAGGLVLQVGGLLGRTAVAVTAGELLVTSAALGHLALLVGLFVERYG